MNEWKECRLGDVATVRGGKRLPKGKMLKALPTNHPYIRITDFSGHKILLDGIQYVDDEVQESIARYTVSAGDLVISIVGTLGLCAIIPKELDKANLTENCATIHIKEDNVEKLYLYYHLVSTETQDTIVGFDVGSTQPKLPLYNVENINLSLPPLLEQRAIAGVLSSLDNKIGLLHRQNKTLEGMAEALWRKMFVEEADASWDEVSLLEIIDLVGGGTPKTEVAEYWDGSIHWLAAKDITGNHKSFILQTEKTITEAGLNNSSAKLLPKYSTIISARGTVGNYCILSRPMAYSQSNYGVLPKIKECYFFTYLLIAHVMDELKMAAYGSVFDTITTNTFKEQKVRVPSKDQIGLFENGIQPYFNKIYTNTIQIRTLSRLRDTLLPKLMSGEVRVKL